MGRAPCSSLLAAIVASTLAIPAYAEGSATKTAQRTLSPAYKECLNTGDARMGVMPAMFDCGRDELSRQDEVLNSAYRAVRKNLTPAKQNQLQVLERRWIAQRDKKCKAKLDGSQDGTLLWYGCLIHETERRIEWLKNFARKA
ncbi:MAG TPA: lysozyme inhibitor LprI family protein [Rhizomicrobium sp.]|nr:lysozyme inhibitor LprI family protein [Rhizomicrobium sp.]